MMTKRTTAADPQIHALTRTEINRQIKLHTDRYQQIVNERAAVYASAKKNGGDIPAVDADERAAREHAKNLLNGSAPALSLPPELSRDKILFREQRALDIVLKILGQKELAERAAEAVAWAEAHEAEWRALCAQIVLTVNRLEALEHSAWELIGQCVDVFAVRLPLANLIGGRPLSETPISDLTEAALTEGVITKAQLERARSNG